MESPVKPERADCPIDPPPICASPKLVFFVDEGWVGAEYLELSESTVGSALLARFDECGPLVPEERPVF